MPHPSRTNRRSGFFSALIALALTLVIVPVAQAATPRNLDVTEGRAVAPQRYDVEKYILRLMNCIRTGGTLRTDAGCTGYGSGNNGGYRAPYKLNKAASDRVARPYAKLLVSINQCNHWFDGAPDYRLRRGGISFSNYGENIGCRDGEKPFKSVLASMLHFQSEKSYNGWHWRNIKEPRLSHVGIGIWKSGTRIRFVTDFYRP